MTSARLFNCCTDHAAPEWSRFVHLELAGSRNDSEDLNETSIVGLQPVSRSDFFTIYGRLAEPDGICEPITVIEDAARALAVAAKLAALFGLSCIVHASLMEDGR
ncbi:MAG: hypothetical protein R3D70_22630 [Rhizobiaceae bacterium]|jgi:hypothetical protein